MAHPCCVAVDIVATQYSALRRGIKSPGSLVLSAIRSPGSIRRGRRERSEAKPRNQRPVTSSGASPANGPSNLLSQERIAKRYKRGGLLFVPAVAVSSRRGLVEVGLVARCL